MHIKLVFWPENSMLNQAAVEALYSATYVENYLDCVENLPDDLQRHLSRMRELDVTYQGTCCNFFFFAYFIWIVTETKLATLV